MSREREPGSHDAPTERHGYITAGGGYVPPRTAEAPTPQPRRPALDDYRNHPLHHVYRKRIRGIRMRWLGSGMLLGLLGGIVLTLLASALVVTQFPVAQYFSGDPDVAVVIGEAYLNRSAVDRLKGGYSTGVSALTLTGLKMDLKPGARMDLQSTFNADLGITRLDINPAVKNQLAVQNGKLVISMVGDPQLGDLNVPLEFLPFDLNSALRNAIDKVNNDLIIAEINNALQAGFGDGTYTVEGVTTTETAMSIRLQHR